MKDYRPTRDYLLLIDGSSFIHRNYHALPKLTRQTDGLQTGALYGLANTLLKLLRLNWTAIERLPKYAAMTLDVRGPNWRHQVFPEYKAQRKPYEADLLVQLPHIPTMAAGVNVPSIGVPGYEADDIIATYVKLADEAGVDTVIATSDKRSIPAGRRVRRRHVVIIYDSMKDKGRKTARTPWSATRSSNAKMGVWPTHVADFLGADGGHSRQRARLPSASTPEGGRAARAIRFARGHPRRRRVERSRLQVPEGA